MTVGAVTAPAAERIAPHAWRVLDPELRGQVHRDGPRDVRGGGQERAQETDGAQLHGEPEPVVLPAADVDQGPVGGVEVEVPGQLAARAPVTRVRTL